MIYGDIFSVVFGYLSVRDRCSSLTVCKNWRDVIAEYNNWSIRDYCTCVENNLLFFVMHNNCVSNMALIIAADRGHIAIVKFLLTQPEIDPSAFDAKALMDSIKYKGSIASILINDDRVYQTINKQFVLDHAVKHRHIEVITKLMPDPAVDHTQFGRYLCRMLMPVYYVGIVRLFVEDPRTDLSYEDNWAIIQFVTLGDIEMVRLAMANKTCNPAARNNAALHTALRNKRYDIVSLLITDKRVDASIIFK